MSSTVCRLSCADHTLIVSSPLSVEPWSLDRGVYVCAERMRMRTSSATDRDSHPCNYVNADRARIAMTMTISP